MKRFVICMMVLGMFLTGCMRQEPATVATISPGPEIMVSEGI